MRLSGFWQFVGILLVVAACSCSAFEEYSKNNRNRPKRIPVKKLDLSIPLGHIGSDLNAVLENPLNLSAIIEPILECFTEASVDEQRNLFAALPNGLKEDFETKLQNYLLAFKTLTPNENITKYCNSKNFETIHNFLWVEDIQFKDMVNFFQKFGYENIYTNIIALYDYFDCPDELIATIQTGPPETSAKSASYSQQHKADNNMRNQVLLSPAKEFNTNSMQITAECNILTILMGFLNSGLVELLKLIETILYEIMTESSMHYLIGKISEPIKGISFRTFRLLIPVRELFVYFHNVIVNIPLLEFVFDFVETQLGLDLRAVNLIETILNILEALVWGNMEPVPPYEPSQFL